MFIFPALIGMAIVMAAAVGISIGVRRWRNSSSESDMVSGSKPNSTK